MKYSNTIIEPFNAMLANSYLSKEADAVIVFDNQSLYRICNDSLDILLPSFKNINHIISNVFSFLTLSTRFKQNNLISWNIWDIITNLMPYNHMHFLYSTIYPLLSLEKLKHEKLTIENITNEDSSMINLYPWTGKYIACACFYKGQVDVNEVSHALTNAKFKHKIKFVDFCPTGFKWGVNSTSIRYPSSWTDIPHFLRSFCLLCHSTSVIYLWKKILKDFTLMYNKRAFVHWLVSEGLQESELLESKIDLESLIIDYDYMQKQIPILSPKDQMTKKKLEPEAAG